MISFRWKETLRNELPYNYGMLNIIYYNTLPIKSHLFVKEESYIEYVLQNIFMNSLLEMSYVSKKRFIPVPGPCTLQYRYTGGYKLSIWILWKHIISHFWFFKSFLFHFSWYRYCSRYHYLFVWQNWFFHQENRCRGYLRSSDRVVNNRHFTKCVMFVGDSL